MPLEVLFVSPGIGEALQHENFHLFQEAKKMERNILWQCQTSCEIASRARDTAMTTLFLQVWMVKDVQKPSKLKLHRSTTWNLLQLSRFPYC